MNPDNARKYGEVLLGITRDKGFSLYTVIGLRGKLLNFAILNSGKRIKLAGLNAFEEGEKYASNESRTG